MVELHTLNPSTQKLESYRYPLVDTKNATSVIKLLEITINDTSKVGGAKCSTGAWLVVLLILKVTTKVKSLSYSFSDLWSDYEYMVRCGWLADGKR